MARSKYTFEKRQKEKARQQKTKEKVARRLEAKQLKSHPEQGNPLEDAGGSGTSTDLDPLTESMDTIAPKEEGLP